MTRLSTSETDMRRSGIMRPQMSWLCVHVTCGCSGTKCINAWVSECPRCNLARYTDHTRVLLQVAALA